ncbi:hypothetical protein NA78x_000773 [Anatilimnocola sp. NA78]|uniref:hypothetical protein n=1 Tax=Anatilimnocola sp. NA78 TaxID=3415683 RepID=UPI003CE57596
MNEDEQLDIRLRSALVASAPVTMSANLEPRTRQRIRARALRHMLVRSAVVLTAIATLIGVRNWPPSRTPVSAVASLQTAELESLFAPPPVISLSVLDRQQEFALRALRRLEANP